MNSQRVLFISDYSKWSQSAYQYITSIFNTHTGLFYERGDSCNKILDEWEGDWIFSFKSELLLPKNILQKARCGALNFHPSPPKYRGIGGYILALKNRDNQFGATCHHMNQSIDFGKIVMTSYFEICSDESLLTLYHKTAFHCLKLLFNVTERIRSGEPLPESTEDWGNELFKYKDFSKDLETLKTVEVKY